MVTVQRLGWLGIQTSRFDATSAFFKTVMGLSVVHEENEVAVLGLPGADHDWVEVFGQGSDDEAATLYTTGPVVGFTVEDLVQARRELEIAAVELIGDIGWSKRVEGYGWFHFRGPDGNIYVMLQGSHAVPGA